MNKKIILLWAVYVWWVIATLLYNKKTDKEIQKELLDARTKWEWDFKVLFNNFIEIHKNLLDNLKAKTLTEENKEFINKKKDEFLIFIDDYKEKAQEIFEEYKVLWKDYAEEAIEKLEKFYNEKLNDLEKLKEKAPEKIDEIKSKLITISNDLKSKIKK